MGNYSDDLQHPLWQRKRLEIMQQANWRCIECGSVSDMLTVHHSQYIKGRKPWEYPNELLLCLCADCHLTRQNIEDSLKIEMMKRLRHVPIERLQKVFWYLMEEALKESEAA